MANVLTIIRLSEDEAGESHFDEYRVDQPDTPFAPPALPFMVSARRRRRPTRPSASPSAG